MCPESGCNYLLIRIEGSTQIMNRKLAQVVAVAVVMALSSRFAWAQEDETYDFDGVADMDPQPDDPTDWMTSVNWSDGGFDPNPLFGPPIPDFGTRVEIRTSTFGVDAPEIGPGDAAQAHEVRIGREEGPGLLTITGGTLETVNSCTASPFTCNRRLRVGASDSDIARHPGTFNLIDGQVTTDNLWIGSGSHGEMNMSGGVVTTRENLYFDWTFDAGSVLNMTGGTINVGGIMRMYRTSELNLDGGQILVAGPAELGTQNNLPPCCLQTPDITATITSGLLASNNFLQIGGSVIIDGGILRAASFNESVSAGTIEVNEGGILQFNNAQESIASVQNLISSGFITTSSPLGTAGFVVEIVDVSGTNFTQVSFATMPGVLGDFNDDGKVDAADYAVWRKNDTANNPLPNDNALTTQAGRYDLWVDNFGNMPGSGSGLTAGAVPEPTSVILALMLAGVAVLRRRARGGLGEFQATRLKTCAR